MSVQTKSNLLPSGLTLGPLGGAVCSGPAREGDGEEGEGRERKTGYEKRGRARTIERERVTKEEEEEEVVADLNLSGGPLRA